MSTEYSFYFDETYHDRKITLKNNKLNILSENVLDDYIGFFWGTRENNINNIFTKLVDFENKYRNLFTLTNGQELKCRSFNNKQFKFGIHSFDKLTLDFYIELFDICNNHKMLFQIDIISKMEILVRQLFSDVEWFRNNGYIYNVFVYSFTKMLIYYNHTELISSLCNLQECSNKETISIIVKTIVEIVEAGKDVKRKGSEVPIFKELIRILKTPDCKINPSNSQDWVYFANFDGLCKLLKEVSINPKRINLLIDNDEKTVDTAKKYPFKAVHGVISADNIGIRLSDWLVGFIGKNIWGIVHDPNAIEEKVTNITKIKTDDFSRRRVLSPDWFRLDEKQFECYKKAANCFIKRQQHHWTVLHCAYADHTIQFFALLRYIDQFDYPKYLKLTPERHRDEYTKMSLLELTSYYKDIEKI